MSEGFTRRAWLRGGLGPVLGMAASRTLPAATDPASLTLEQASGMIRRKALSPVELTRSYLARIEKLNTSLGAFITVTAEQALAQARERETEIARGRRRGALDGIPVALKDLIDTAGVRTTAASALYKDRVPAEDAEVVRRLRAAGAVLIGKLNMDQFAFDFTGSTSHFGLIRNPWKPGHSPGGSSGGSAVAVAAGLCCAALGSDTGGSIRLPASLCGITGLKPTYGLVSTRGVLPLAWSLDHLGPMCRTAADAALLLQAMAGHDPQESTSIDAPAPDYYAGLGARTSTLRLGLPRAPFFEALDPEVEAAVNQAIEVLRRLTAGVREVAVPPSQPIPIVFAEAHAYHAAHLAKHASLYHPRIRRQLESGAQVPTSVYIQARLDLDRVRREVAGVFSQVDLLVTPTAPRPAPPHDLTRDPDLILLRNTFPFNAYGLPVISVPCGFTAAGLPVGIQIAGPRLGETRVLALAHAFQRSTDWHLRHPPDAV